MRLRWIGHAGFILESGSTRILIDPWFNPAFLGTWRPQPDNSHLADEVAALRYDYVCVSHGHEDHHDKRFLARLGEPFSLSGYTVIHGDREGGPEYYSAGKDFLIKVIRDDHRADSMFLVQCEGKRILFANDCNLEPAVWPESIDILACQFSGASYYPTAYDYPPEVMARKIEEARANQMAMLVAKVRRCGAKAYIPCAGPAKIENQADGPGTPFPHWAELDETFRHVCPDVRVIKLDVGEWYDDEPPHVMTRGNTTFTMPAYVHRMIEDGECSFEEALLSFKIKLHRDPDVYDREMMEELRGRKPR